MELAFGIVFWVVVALFVIARRASGPDTSTPRAPARQARQKPKRYVMRGYGGGKNATSLHPRQAAKGKRIVYIPGVGYRHVKPGGKRKR